MKLGIMQPYLFPYIGYFQLLELVDRYVVCDNVQYTKESWINRNRLLADSKTNADTYFTFAVKKGERNASICDRFYSDQMQKDKEKLLHTLQFVYKKAPYFQEMYPKIEEWLSYEEHQVAKFNVHMIKKVAEYLDIHTEIIISSEVTDENYRKEAFKRQDMVKYMCHYFGGDEYVNAIGGTVLYLKEDFARDNIKLGFIKTDDIHYKQFSKEFVPNLSIIDVMMFNTKEEVKALLHQCTII